MERDTMNTAHQRETVTVAAPATAPGGALCVVRVSGPDAIRIAGLLWKGRRPLTEVRSHRIAYGLVTDPAGEPIDQAVATVFRAPHSYTGEDTVELSLHGSPAVLRSVLDALAASGAVMAGPGEFTRRAFLNGRLDLASAEGVADLIAASSDAARRLALSQTRGEYTRRFDSIREDLIHFASLIELELDFSEEEVEFADRTQLRALAERVLHEVDRLVDSYAAGRVLKEGVPVVIAGAPNAGKSTLLNRLIGDDKAIVSPIPGTTRDTVEDTVQLDGILYRFIDTAGLRSHTDDPIESIGIERTRAALERASVILWLTAPTPSDISMEHPCASHVGAEPVSCGPEQGRDGTCSQKSIPVTSCCEAQQHDGTPADTITEYTPGPAQTVIHVITKSDLIDGGLSRSMIASSPANNLNPQDKAEAPDTADLRKHDGDLTAFDCQNGSVMSVEEGIPVSSDIAETGLRTYGQDMAVPGGERASGEGIPVSSDIAETGLRTYCQDMAVPSGERVSGEGIPVSSDNTVDEKSETPLLISARTGQGIPQLLERLRQAATRGTDPGTDLIITNARHHHLLKQAAEALTRVLRLLDDPWMPADLIAQDLRQSIAHLGELTGAVTPDDILSNIFSHFCIGK